MSEKIVLIGAGSQGRVTLDILDSCGYEVIGFLDDNESLWGNYVNGKKVLGGLADAQKILRDECKFIISVGNNYLREKIFERLKLDLSLYKNAIHSSSVVLKSVSKGNGNMIFANTFIGTDSTIGNHVIVNNGVTIEHDCQIKDFVTISPGCCMGGRVVILEGAFLSVGVTLSPRVTIGANSRIGSGSVVVDDIPSGVLAYGAPARIIKNIAPDEMWDRFL